MRCCGRFFCARCVFIIESLDRGKQHTHSPSKAHVRAGVALQIQKVAFRSEYAAQLRRCLCNYVASVSIPAYDNTHERVLITKKCSAHVRVIFCLRPLTAL
jgi:hypothetical protein